MFQNIINAIVALVCSVIVGLDVIILAITISEKQFENLGLIALGNLGMAAILCLQQMITRGMIPIF